MTAAGASMIAYGSQPVLKPSVSHIMTRDTAGNKQFRAHSHKGTKYVKPANYVWTPLGRKEGWHKASNYERSHTANRSRGKSSRYRNTSTASIYGGGTLVAGGRIVPYLGWAWVIHDVLYPNDPLVDDAREHVDRSTDPQSYKDAFSEYKRGFTVGYQFGKSFYSSPVGKIAMTVALSKLGF